MGTLKVDRIIRYTEALLVGRGPFPRRTCLRGAVTLYYFLTREGLDMGICFGAARSREGLIGHCW